VNGTTTPCAWRLQKMLSLPTSVQFRDYSGLALRHHRAEHTPNGGAGVSQLAVISQEDAKVAFVYFNLRTLEFEAATAAAPEHQTSVYDFPRNAQCEILYCNVEGVDYIDDRTLVLVSDKMKKKGKARQSFVCREHDQSIHVMVIDEM
jgi:hypothetical protein